MKTLKQNSLLQKVNVYRYDNLIKTDKHLEQTAVLLYI